MKEDYLKSLEFISKELNSLYKHHQLMSDEFEKEMVIFKIKLKREIEKIKPRNEIER